MEEKKERSPMAHVLVLPYPSQGHINPMLQFAKRLISKGPKATLVTTLFHINSLQPETDPIGVEPISDGYDRTGVAGAGGLDEYLKSLADIGSRTLAELIEEKRKKFFGLPFTCIVYDTYVPWARDVAKRLGLPAVVFSTQSCAASAIYHYVQQGLLVMPSEGHTVPMYGLPPLEKSEFPSMVLNDGNYPTLTGLSLSQFASLEKEDWALFNTFEELESMEVKGLMEQWHVKTIGPTVPSMFVDKRLDGDDNYTLNLLEADDTCTKWLDSKPIGSVVYVSFGSFVSLSEEQMEEIAWGLKDSNTFFLWVVRAPEMNKLPGDFIKQAEKKGLVVTWCPQLEVLSHKSLGCFVTHCGWNSTLEALSLGVPMIAVPQWTDQPTNAKYVEEFWGVGVRARTEDTKMVSREEIRRCIGQVMGGERGEKIKRNAKKWSELAKLAVSEGGSSDKNMNEFVEFLNAKALNMI